MSAHPNDPAGPDLSPWDTAITTRVQPILSALFHDIMGPLSLIKNRTYLIRRHINVLEHDPSLPAEVRAKVSAIAALLDGVDEASHRIHRGMAVPRDAIWESVLEGTAFEPEQVIVDLGVAMKGQEPLGTPEKQSAHL